MITNLRKNQSYNYLTNFFLLRSIVALCCGIGTLILAFYGIIAGVIRTIEVMNANGFLSFIFYTMISNTLAICSISFVIPYAVEGIQKKRFVLPRWVTTMHFLSTTSIAITMVLVISFMSWASPDDAFGGSNLILHIICPVLILISFFQIENNSIYKLKDCLIGCIPFYIYIIVYFIEVYFISEENGGWPDIYQIREHISLLMAVPLSLVLPFVVSWMIAALSNHFTKVREKKLFKYWKKDIDFEEAKKEAYKIGEMMSKLEDRSSVIIPLDVLEYISKKSNINMNDLINSYVKGLLSGQPDEISNYDFIK